MKCISSPCIHVVLALTQRACNWNAYLSVNCCMWYLYSTATSISGRDHPFAVASVLFIWFLTSIKWPADYLCSIWRIILNKSSVIYWAKFFHVLTVDAKRLKKLANDVLDFFCTSCWLCTEKVQNIIDRFLRPFGIDSWYVKKFSSRYHRRFI